MNQKERQNTILSLILQKQQELSSQDEYVDENRLRWREIVVAREFGWIHATCLADHFPSVTRRTIERDLESLNRRGLIDRIDETCTYQEYVPMDPDEDGRRFYARLTDEGMAVAQAERTLSASFLHTADIK